jgi:hypothetical protein
MRKSCGFFLIVASSIPEPYRFVPAAGGKDSSIEVRRISKSVDSAGLERFSSFSARPRRFSLTALKARFMMAV